jgi:hypothetical protein
MRDGPSPGGTAPEARGPVRRRQRRGIKDVITGSRDADDNAAAIGQGEARSLTLLGRSMCPISGLDVGPGLW